MNRLMPLNRKSKLKATSSNFLATTANNNSTFFLDNFKVQHLSDKHSKYIFAKI